MVRNKFSSYRLRIWSIRVRRRDKRCQVCGSIKRREAHHLYDKTYHPDLAYDLDNGITVCRPCHASFHIDYRGSYRKKCTELEFAKFSKIANGVHRRKMENEEGTLL